jgi:hypothetical protein
LKILNVKKLLLSINHSSVHDVHIRVHGDVRESVRVLYIMHKYSIRILTCNTALEF